jgi:hypothetical protein
MEEARARGIVVEVTYVTVAAPPRIAKAEELGAAGLYAAYAEAVGLPPAVAAEGRAVLEEVAASTAAADVDGTVRRCRLTLSMRELKAPMASALEATLS